MSEATMQYEHAGAGFHGVDGAPVPGVLPRSGSSFQSGDGIVPVSQSVRRMA